MNIQEALRRFTTVKAARVLLSSGFLVLLVTIRAVSDTLGLLPKSLRTVDLLFLPLLLLYLCGYMLIRRKSRLVIGDVGPPMLLFLLVVLVSAAVNAEYMYPPSLLLLIYGTLSPVVIALIYLNVDYEEDEIRLLIKTFWLLGWLQVVIGTVQANLYVLGKLYSPDQVSGTFGANNSQMVFFLVLFAVLLISDFLFEVKPYLNLLAIPAIFLVFYAASFQVSWVSFPLTIAFLAFFFGRVRLFFRLSFAGVVTALGAAGIFYFQQMARSMTKVFNNITDPAVLGIGKVQVFHNIVKLWGDMPHSLLIGVGPGTFGSRAFRTFANIDEPLGQGYTPYHVLSPLAEQYIVPIMPSRYYTLFGSGTLESPYTSYASIPAETGLIGAFFFFSIYLGAFWMAAVLNKWAARHDDRFYFSVSLAVMGGILFLAQIAIMDNWFEVTRATIPLWMLIFVVMRKLYLIKKDSGLQEGENGST